MDQVDQVEVKIVPRMTIHGQHTDILINYQGRHYASHLNVAVTNDRGSQRMAAQQFLERRRRFGYTL